MQTLAELKRRDVSPLPAIEPAMMCQSVEEVRAGVQALGWIAARNRKCLHLTMWLVARQG